MNQLIAGLFPMSEPAGAAIGVLKQKGYTKDISVIAKDWESDKIKSHDIKKDVGDGATAGAVTGATMGVAVGVISAAIAGLVAVVVPPAGLIVAGPLAAGLAGAAAGAVAGGVIGSLVKAGFPEEKAKMFQHQIELGDTLVAVSAPQDKAMDVQAIMEEYGASGVEVFEQRA